MAKIVLAGSIELHWVTQFMKMNCRGYGAYIKYSRTFICDHTIELTNNLYVLRSRCLCHASYGWQGIL